MNKDDLVNVLVGMGILTLLFILAFLPLLVFRFIEKVPTYTNKTIGKIPCPLNILLSIFLWFIVIIWIHKLIKSKSKKEQEEGDRS